MRFERWFAESARSVQLDAREVERIDAVVPVTAPSDWTDVRIESWLDWLEAAPTDLPDTPPPWSEAPAADPAFDGGLSAFATRLAHWGWALGLFDTAGDAQAFREDIAASLLLGVAAPGALRAAGARVCPFTGPDASAPAPSERIIDLAAAGGAARLQGVLAEARARRRAAPALAQLDQRLAAVAEAVARCEGDRRACADPAANPALARAARAARAAGADDAALIDAIALGQQGRTPLPSARDTAQRPLPVVAVAGDFAAAAEAAWDAGSLLIADGADSAAAHADSLAAPCAAVNLTALQIDGRTDEEALAAAVRLWTVALEILTAAGLADDEAGARRVYEARGGRLTLAGVAELRVAQGLAADAPELRRLLLLASVTALETSTALGRLAGPAPDALPRAAAADARLARLASLADACAPDLAPRLRA